MTPLAQVFDLSIEMLWLHVAVFLRVAPIIGLLPGFGESSVPMRIKLVLVIAFTLIVAPVLSPDLADHARAPTVGLILSETIVGLALGVALRLFLMALQMAGSIAAQSTSLAQILGNASQTPLPAIGHLLATGAVALMMIMGVHVRLAEMIVLSYGIFPVAEFPDVGTLSQWGVARIAQAFSFGFSLAAPFVLVSVLYNLTLGIINRAMPQLMVVLVGAPAAMALTLFLLMLVVPTMLVVWLGAFQSFVTNPFGG
ncbi:Flagellar biosynthesis protein FliR [Roseovarius sp. EC-HK134]|uniref:flagellar biosynthetic protein FliR n=1 Tax=unclassified Roseovarius TaxID=2614913 RepID=UPI00125C727A|nr:MULTISPECIES: flagellar biosynthetic protein FliR [unclassified Roseovarius]VVT15702.1 Flagellar biosynthesis protein FliR [Roseovarius sp. EC-HK134]VVT16305.1 Flagellar biosynthesis protein FliR [Roseovarius sp. EC-SD190]